MLEVLCEEECAQKEDPEALIRLSRGYIRELHGVEIPFLSEEECKTRGFEPGKLPPFHAWSPEQQAALYRLGEVIALMGITDVIQSEALACDDNGCLAERRALKRLNRTCSGLNSLVGQLRAAIKNRSLEQSDRYALYLLIEKYTRRFVELDRKRKLIKRQLSAECQRLGEKGQKQCTKETRSRSKKKQKTKAKKKRKLRYPKTPIQMEHAAKKKQLHHISGSRSIRARFVPGGATGLKK